MNTDREMMLKALAECEYINEEKVLFYTWNVRGLTFIKVRDILYANAKILMEDAENSIYVARVRCGLLYSGSGVVAVKTGDGTVTVAAYAREGLIKTHRGERISNELKDRLKEYII